MGRSIYVADPAVADAYHTATGQWTYVFDDDEAAWLVASHHGFGTDQAAALPAAGYVHPDAPLPFEPYNPVPSRTSVQPGQAPQASAATPPPPPAQTQTQAAAQPQPQAPAPQAASPNPPTTPTTTTAPTTSGAPGAPPSGP